MKNDSQCSLVGDTSILEILYCLQAIFPPLDEDLPQIIYVVTDLLGLDNNIINAALEAILEHLMKDGTQWALIGDTSIFETLYCMQVILPACGEDLPHIIYVVTDLLGLYNNIFNVTLEAIMEHL